MGHIEDQNRRLGEALAPGHVSSNSVAEQLARDFHETYERLAPGFHYDTRNESAVPWDEVPEPNRSLMVAVAQYLIDADRAIPNRVCGALGIAAGDACLKPEGHEGPHEGAISAHATPNRVQAQDSLADQVTRVIRMANDAGERDAADWMLSMWREKAWRT